MKKLFKILGIVILAIIALVVLFIMTYKPAQYSDFGVFDRLKTEVIQLCGTYGATPRAVTKDFETFRLDVSFPFNLTFGSKVLAVPLKAWENEKLTTVTISQFMIPDPPYYRDFTLNVRPRYAYRVPILHIDFMKPNPGVPGMCILDFFNVDPEQISYEEFFGSDLPVVKQALAMVEPYQRTVEDGRGKISRYLDPYKSPYRFELKEPRDEDERQQYFKAAGDAISMLLPVYFAAVARVQADPAYSERHEAKTVKLVRDIYDNDFAVAMGRKIFKEHFLKFWLEGFWVVDINL